MNIVPQKGSFQIFVQEENGEREIDLSTIDPAGLLKNDVVRHRLTGEIPSIPDFRLGNFVESILNKVTAYEIDFSECDFKDTLVREGLFTNCRFDNGTFATSFFADCEFRGCTFYNVAVHSSEFHRVRFARSNLTNLLIKSSRFVDCEFVGCTTSNKLMEMSTLDQTKFQDTDIQMQTITSNFGLASEDLLGSRIRSGRVREDFSFLNLEDVEKCIQDVNFTPIERLRIEYFLRHHFLDGSTALDQALDLGRWTKTCKNPGSFVELLESFSEFLVHLYQSSKITSHAIMLLHNVTSNLAQSLPTAEDLHRVNMSIGGTHLVLSRIVEEFLTSLEELATTSENGLTLLVNGPDDPDFYVDELSPWFNKEEMRITRLVKHNSPNELSIAVDHITVLLPLLAAFLSTRTKFEIIQLRDKRKSKVASASLMRRPTSRLAKREEQEKLLSISTGWTEEKSYQIQVRSILPGSLLLDLKLQFSTQIAGRIRKVIIDLLS